MWGQGWNGKKNGRIQHTLVLYKHNGRGLPPLLTSSSTLLHEFCCNNQWSSWQKVSHREATRLRSQSQGNGLLYLRSNSQNGNSCCYSYYHRNPAQFLQVKTRIFNNQHWKSRQDPRVNLSSFWLVTYCLAILPSPQEYVCETFLLFKSKG